MKLKYRKNSQWSSISLYCKNHDNVADKVNELFNKRYKDTEVTIDIVDIDIFPVENSTLVSVIIFYAIV